jgi:hypothetical protein
MTIDEAIKYAKEVAKKQENNAKNYPRPDRSVRGSGKKYNAYLKSAEEHRQLAEWLKELKQLREQEPSDDCISREDALMCLTGEWTEPTDELIHRFIRRIKNLPSVNPQEPKTGHWIYDNDTNTWRCDKCGETPKTMGYVGTDKFMAEHFKFCNHCGAKNAIKR